MKTISVVAGAVMLVLSLAGAVSPQSTDPAATPTPTPTPAPDIRNLAPTLGAGGAPGGPTGLFTVYDGRVLGPGESTTSFGYSNYDRDPGNVDIAEILGSYHFGIGFNTEIFFQLNVYRGIKVNNPQNLSGFYLPNSQLFFGNVLRSGAAIVLAPVNNAGIQGAVFRPVGNQPFVQFPFVGGSAGNFQNGFSGTNSRFTFTLGPASGGAGHPFGTASNFPGIGSPYGSILPGIVLLTGVQPATLTTSALTVPRTFTIAPTYLPDAPFVNRLYGESSLNYFIAGAKVRLTNPENAIGFGFVPFYRSYSDSAGDVGGFNQLQRGAGPGATLGDFGVVMFADGRLSRHVNLAANLGFVFTTNPQSNAFGGGDATLLDRPNEIIAGLGFDFPVNRYVQPVFELRSTHYVGGRTPNALENNPVDVLAGLRLFTKHFEKGIFKNYRLGFGAAYRLHLSQQGRNSFASPAPPGFVPSNDPHGFMFQLWLGRRNPPSDGGGLRDTPVKVTVDALVEGEALTLVCPLGTRLASTAADTCPMPATFLVPVNVQLIDNEEVAHTEFKLEWNTGGVGRIENPRVEGDKYVAIWNLSGVDRAGTYPVSVSVLRPSGEPVKDPGGQPVTGIDRVQIKDCPNCITCPEGAVTATPASVVEGDDVTFTLGLRGGTRIAPEHSYTWRVAGGEIKSGQGTSSIKVGTAGRGGTTVTATVMVGGFDASCPAEFNGSAPVGSVPVEPRAAVCRRLDAYGPIKYNDEKARLDNFTIALQGDPRAQGYIIAYRGETDPLVGNIGTEKVRVTGDVCAEYRLERAGRYLINDRKLTQDRFTPIDGGNRPQSSVELWLCPLDGKPPLTPDTSIQRVEGTCVIRGTPISRGKASQPRRDNKLKHSRSGRVAAKRRRKK